MEEPPEEYAPPRRLRSCKRRALVERQVPGANHYNNGSQQPPQKRIRRIQAYSDLECSDRPRDSPTIPISVDHQYWLEDAIIKARKIIHDKENAETVLQRVAGAPSVESLSTPVPLRQHGPTDQPRLSLSHKNKTEDLRTKYSSPASSDSGERRTSLDSLHRKGKSQDLRSRYSSPGSASEQSTASESLHRKAKSVDLRSQYSSPTSIDEDRTTPDSLPSLEECQLPSSEGTADSPKSPSSLQSQQGFLYCICQQTFDHSLGEMAACDICDGWFHLSCVGQDQHDAAYFEDKEFYCPRCEAFAYQEIVSVEDGAA